MFIMAPVVSLSSNVHVSRMKNTHTDSNVGPADTLLTWFFLDSHYCEPMGVTGGLERTKGGGGESKKVNLKWTDLDPELAFGGIFSFGAVIGLRRAIAFSLSHSKVIPVIINVGRIQYENINNPAERNRN